MAVFDDTAVIGAPWDNDNGDMSGSAYAFRGLSDCQPNGTINICDITDGTSQDNNGNGIPDECECVGDLDSDCDTDHSDFGALLSAWGSQPGDPNWNENADLDGDGHVGHADLGILLADWGCTGGDCPGDCDGDGDTDQEDLGILLAHWGEGCPQRHTYSHAAAHSTVSCGFRWKRSEAQLGFETRVGNGIMEVGRNDRVLGLLSAL